MSQKITALRVQKNNRERINVYLDDKYAFAISVAAAETLANGQLLDAEDIMRLRREGDADLAYHRALRYLGYRPRSEFEITQYLRGKEHLKSTIEQVLDRLRSRSYVDDHAFAEFWVDNRTRFRPRGERALRAELRQKGIDRDVIDDVLEKQDESAAAMAALEQRADRWRALDRDAFKHKALGYLSRRGFGYGICRQAIQDVWTRLQESAS